MLDSTLRVSDARFERNQAGWVGGAIYAFGKWSEPVDVPRSDLTVVRSTSLENAAVNDPCCVPPGPTQGGALHVENRTTLRLQHSQLLANRAKLGGAIDSYRGPCSPLPPWWGRGRRRCQARSCSMPGAAGRPP